MRDSPPPTECPECWEDAGQVLGDPGISTIYLSGPPGFGKTYAALALGRVNIGLDSVGLPRRFHG